MFFKKGMPHITKLYHICLDILFPPLCLACNILLSKSDKNQQLCDTCLGKIIMHTTLLCPVCGNRLPNNSAEGGSSFGGKKICHFESSYLLAAASDYHHNPIIEKLINVLKFQSTRAASVPLSYIMLKYFKLLNLKLKNFVVVPVPLHKKRFRERGFNQSELLAKKIALGLNLPLNTNTLIKIKNTAAQTEVKNKNNREKNLIGCFRLNNETLTGKNILLIDDVHTTGATAKTISEILKTNGAKKIIVLVAGRT